MAVVPSRSAEVAPSRRPRRSPPGCRWPPHGSAHCPSWCPATAPAGDSQALAEVIGVEAIGERAIARVRGRGRGPGRRGAGAGISPPSVGRGPPQLPVGAAGGRARQSVRRTTASRRPRRLTSTPEHLRASEQLVDGGSRAAAAPGDGPGACCETPTAPPGTTWTFQASRQPSRLWSPSMNTRFFRSSADPRPGCGRCASGSSGARARRRCGVGEDQPGGSAAPLSSTNGSIRRSLAPGSSACNITAEEPSYTPSSTTRLGAAAQPRRTRPVPPRARARGRERGCGSTEAAARAATYTALGPPAQDPRRTTTKPLDLPRHSLCCWRWPRIADCNARAPHLPLPRSCAAR